MAMMTLDSEAVTASVNQIDVSLDNISNIIKTLEGLVNDNIDKTQGKFPLLKNLGVQVEKEVGVLQGTLAACERIKESIRVYGQMAAEATDGDVFAGGD